MSYHIYNATGLVLKEKPLREADLLLKILTRELGMLNAVAVGLRKGNSKRRPPLTEMSLSKIALVRGKKDWRVTSASLENNLYQSLKTNKKILLAIARALNLLENLIQGEEKHPELFDEIHGFISLALEEDLSGLEKIFESILVARILSRLGYLDEREFEKGIFNDDINKQLLLNFDLNNKFLIVAINKGIKESGLL